MHQLGDALTFTALPLACFVLARRFAREPHWRGWATYSVASTTVGPAGLFEKLAAAIMSIWLLLLAARLLTGTGRVSVAAA
jgi:hypothetical protein